MDYRHKLVINEAKAVQQQLAAIVKESESKAQGERMRELLKPKPSSTEYYQQIADEGRREREAAEAAKIAEKELAEARQRSMQDAYRLYPDLNDPNSEMSRTTKGFTSYIAASSPDLLHDPGFPLYAAETAAKTIAKDRAKAKVRTGGIPLRSRWDAAPESASDKLDAIQRQLQMQENQRQIEAFQQRMKDNRITR